MKPELERVAEKLAKAALHADRINEGAAVTILTDLASGRRGWFHDLLGCYIDTDSLAREELREAALHAAAILQIALPESCYAEFYGL